MQSLSLSLSHSVKFLHPKCNIRNFHAVVWVVFFSFDKLCTSIQYFLLKEGKKKKKISVHLLNLYFAICPYLNIYKDDFMEHIITIIILPYLNIYKDDFKENIITIIAIITCLSYLLKKDKYKILLSD